MLLGFALTRHCNLRCPHCIRDDVTEVRALPVALVVRAVDEARELFGQVTASFTGGEPTLHPQWGELVDALRERGVPYRFVSNGWHMRRLMPAIDRSPPQAVRLSLSGATREVHDEERGRGSFDRVLLAVALLTSRRIPTSLSIVIDRRDRHQVRDAADLAEALGCTRIHFILPQPVPGSLERGSDLSRAECWAVRREVEALAAEPQRRTSILLDWGHPVEAAEERREDGRSRCFTFAEERLYVDPDGRVSLCCQLSDYGYNRADTVGDLAQESLGAIWTRYRERLAALEVASRPAGADDPLGELPCLRCARSLGKLAWMGDEAYAALATA